MFKAQFRIFAHTHLTKANNLGLLIRKHRNFTNFQNLLIYFNPQVLRTKFLLPQIIYSRNKSAFFGHMFFRGFNIFINVVFIYLLYNVYEQRSQNIPKTQKFKNAKSNIKFKDVIGIDEYKEELEDVVQFLLNRQMFLKYGAVVPRGILLVGPPGCGKTQLARAVAGESKTAFFHVNASDLIQPLAGSSQYIIRNIFKQARQQKNGAIIFIDEIDSLPNRDQFFSYGKSIINQLLTEMDGFNSSENIIIIGATNREKALDKALTRSGRFDLKIRIRLPVLQNRKKILDYYINKVPFSSNVDSYFLAQKTTGFSPAELKNLVNSAIMHSIKDNRKKADQQDFLKAFEKIKLGISNKFFGDENQKRQIAYREASKAILSEMDDDLPIIEKISLFSVGSEQKGKSITVEKNDKTNYTKQELLKRISYFLAPKVNDEVFFSQQDQNSLYIPDYQQAVRISQNYISQLGMQEDFSLATIDKKYLSEDMRQKVESEHMKILEQCYNMSKKGILKYKNLIQELAEALYQKEEIHRQQLLEIIAKNNIQQAYKNFIYRSFDSFSLLFFLYIFKNSGIVNFL